MSDERLRDLRMEIENDCDKDQFMPTISYIKKATYDRFKATIQIYNRVCIKT